MKTNFYNVQDYGALGDGITDDLPAFQKALQAMQAIPPLLDASGSAVLLVPEGNYFLSKTLILSHQVEILGITGRNGHEALAYNFTVDLTGKVTHVGGLPGGISRLLFPAGITGIQVAYGGPAKGGGNSGAVDQANGTIIRNIMLQGADRSKYTPSIPEEYGHGISVKVQVIIDNCYVFNFAGNGLHFVTPSAPPPTPNGTAWYDIKHPQLGDLYQDNKRGEGAAIVQYNADTIDSQISNVFCFSNLLNGVYVIGSNSGNMLFQSVHSSQNGRYGFFDSERSTGNTYMNCYSDSNIKGDYWHLSSILEKDIKAGNVTYEIAVQNGSGSLYLNCYQETAASTVYSSATIIEGQLSVDGYNDNPVDTEYQLNYKAFTGLDLPDGHFTDRGRPSVIRQNGSGTNASTEIPFGVRVYGGNHNKASTVNTVSVDLGGSRPAVALSLHHDAEGLTKPQELYADTKNWWWTISNGTSLPPLRLSTGDSKWGDPKSIQADDNSLWFQKGFFLDNLRQDPPTNYSHRPNFIGYRWNKPTDTDTSAPRGGWQQGDMVWNHDPSPTSADINLTYAGWMCVSAAQDGVASKWAGVGKLEVLP